MSVPKMVLGTCLPGDPDPQGRCFFLEIPAEIRLRIFSYFYPGTKERPINIDDEGKDGTMRVRAE